MTTQGFELACSNPRCLCGRSSRRSWSTDATYWLFATLAYLKESNTAILLLLVAISTRRQVRRPSTMLPSGMSPTAKKILLSSPHHSTNCQSRNGQSELRFIGRSELRFGSQSQHAWRLSRNIYHNKRIKRASYFTYFQTHWHLSLRWNHHIIPFCGRVRCAKIELISALRSIFYCSEDPEPFRHFEAGVRHSDLRCQIQANMAKKSLSSSIWASSFDNLDATVLYLPSKNAIESPW